MKGALGRGEGVLGGEGWRDWDREGRGTGQRDPDHPPHCIDYS